MNGRSVVFDLDGVLVMSEHLWERAWYETAAEHGREWSQVDTRTCQGKSVPEWADYLGKVAGVDAEAAASAVISKVSAAYERGDIDLIPGALEMVAQVASRVPVALASSAPRTIIDRVMGTTVGHFFAATVSSEEVAAGKPSPDVYLEAVAQLGTHRDRSYAVEDSSNGIRAAAAAGLKVLGIEHARYPIDEDAVCRTVGVFHSLTDVTEVLVELLDGDDRS